MPRDQDANDRTMVERIDPLLGSVLDRRYMIDFRLAAGGFGAIYRATHIKSGHEVALKVLHPQLTNDAGVVARFRREGATMTTLRSPHTITAYELGEADDGTLYIVMELLRGESLFERFRSQGRFEWKRMVKIAHAICDSLGEAHALGIVHRDLKPTNIHLEPVAGDPDFVKVLDFGIAKILHDSDFDSSDLTNAGQMIGTLDYMSPEQMVGGACTGQSDIYTLGILIYEMIAGVRPFAEAQTAAAALAAILKTTPPPLSQRTPVPEDLDRILARCLERDPLKRYKTVGELDEDLRQLISTQELDEVTRTVALDPMEVGAAATFDSIPPTKSSRFPTLPSAGSPPLRAKPSTGARADLTDPLSLQPTTPKAAVPRSEDPRQAPSRAKRVSAAASESDRTMTTPAPKFQRAATAPPTVLPSASPFKTTWPGAQAAPNPSGRPSAPQFYPAPPAPQPPQAPRFPPPPFGVQPSGYQPPPPAPYAPQPGDDGRGSRPVLDLNSFPHPRAQPTAPPGSYPQHAPGGGFDMSANHARDAAMRRWVWIAVLVLAALAGIVLASQL